MRNLNWNGYFNARDLGGLPTPLSTTGSTVFKRVARGPRREMLTDSGWAEARQWGLSTVVDLRCMHEVGGREGDPVIDNFTHSSLVIVSAPTEDQDNPAFREVCFPILDSPEYWRHNWRILPNLVRETMQAIANAETGVLIHCSAGRDRTGMISALLLGNAGVSPDDVAGDYAESVRAMAGAKTHAPTHDRQASWSVTEADQWIAETASIVREAAANTDAVFDTIGLSQDERSRLRELLTEA
ncbi:tyrosine-protein phosphatase [Cryobacterium sp. TMT1-66-1]|uniref:tyrosine-protein phosphatase n=1 Tax=Cryobacterium sp. TMT1-66-1 TaxID=1259242 RepID=UPI00106C9E21|nr:tyrosine-protein phosphatase [Cryobacterium sp. TMT1-66-1]TFD09376.1 tyrosine-protein phosphatase [Cryobacterium sp. TMT1-66-1]